MADRALDTVEVRTVDLSERYSEGFSEEPLLIFSGRGGPPPTVCGERPSEEVQAQVDAEGRPATRSGPRHGCVRCSSQGVPAEAGRLTVMMVLECGRLGGACHREDYRYGAVRGGDRVSALILPLHPNARRQLGGEAHRIIRPSRIRPGWHWYCAPLEIHAYAYPLT